MQLFLTTLLSWSAQVLLLVAAAACVASLIAHPKARLLFWQGILLLAVLIPLIEPRKPSAPVVAPAPAAARIVYGIEVLPITMPQPSPLLWSREDWLAILALGAALRLTWIGAGFARLRTYRQQARALTTPLLPFTSGKARWYASDNIPGPVTYGWLRPSILLPSRVLALPAELREPIACHEWLHVTRRDWLFVIAEELLRSALWFHPAVWFALSRIQLAREQVVDREVIRLTENRESYLDALVAVAEQSLRSDLAPAPLFLRKRQLAVRVKEILKEVPMSPSKFAARLTGACSVTLAAAVAAVWLFPFMSPAQTVADAPGVTVSAGAPLIHRSPVRIPAGASTAGTVILDATLNAKGEVVDAHAISGPVELRRAAIESVLQWHYSPGPAQAQASITFPAASLSAPPAPPAPPASTAFAPPPPPPPPPPTPTAARALANEASATLKSISFEGIGPDAEQQLRSRITVREGTQVMRADLMKITETVQEFDSHLTAVMMINTNNEWTVRVMPSAQALPPPPPPPPSSPLSNPLSTAGPQKIGGNVMLSKVISRADPQYTEEARQAKLQGKVVLAVTVDETGVPRNIYVVHALGLGLDQSAIDAVSQWRFSPTKLNNVPVPVSTQIEVNFRLLD